MANDRFTVTVIGSVHMDLIAVADRLPAPGESLTGHTFGRHAGGKGGNQAAQVALQGVPAMIVTRVGDDDFGGELRQRLSAKGVDISYVATDPAVPTGASPILVGGDGEYASIIVPGAAALLSTADVDAARPAIRLSALVMLQLELPSMVSAYAARVARDLGARVILNASPAPDAGSMIPSSFWSNVDVLIVNAFEASRLLGTPVPTIDHAVATAEALRTTFGVPEVVMTLGKDGAVALGTDGVNWAPIWPVKVVDSVGAGDAFAGTLAAQLVRGRFVGEALVAASAAGALAVTRPGAFDALPTRAEVDELVASAHQRPMRR
jgi:ribokinase